MRTLFALLLTLTLAGASFAAAITYQGHLATNLLPANGTYHFTFTLYDAATAGNTVGTPVILTGVPVTNGLFTVSLDFGVASLFGQNLWLAIGVKHPTDAVYTTLAARQPLTPAPSAYSLRLPFTQNGTTTSGPLFQVTNQGVGGTGIVGAVGSPSMLVTDAGVVGYSCRGNGVHGISDGDGVAATVKAGVTGYSINGYGVKGYSINGTGGHFTVDTGNNAGLYAAHNDNGDAIAAHATRGAGLYAVSTNGRALYGVSYGSFSAAFIENQAYTGGSGLFASSYSGPAAEFFGNNTGNTSTVVTIATLGTGKGLTVNTSNAGIEAVSTNGNGVYGRSANGFGLMGITTGGRAGIYGTTSLGYLNFYLNSGVSGASPDGIGVSGTSDSGTAVMGYSDSEKGGSFGSNTGVGLTCMSESANPFEAYGHFPGGGTVRRAYINNAGDVYASGTFHPGGADFAEMLPASGTLEPGDVLVLDAQGLLVRCTQRNQPTVVGVYSTKPGMTGGAGDGISLVGKVPLAVVGVVPVKVSGENGAIKPGDLLVASATPGHAMKAGRRPQVGTVIGKALEAFPRGTGVIQMLVISH